MTAVDVADGALATVAASIERQSAGHWSLMLGHDAVATPARLVAARARVDDGWLLLTAEAPPAPPSRDAWATLTSNGGFAGGVRYALTSHEPGLHVRVDVPLDAAIDGERRIVTACAALSLAARGGEPVIALPPSPVVTLSADLATRCHATTWPVAPRGADELLIDVGGPGAFRQAVVSARADGTVVAVVPLLEWAVGSHVSEIGRRATARLLLGLSGVVRLVRATAAHDDPASLRFEVAMADPTSAELEHAFAALAGACRLAAAEVTVLCHDEAVARLYLQLPTNAAVPRAA